VTITLNGAKCVIDDGTTLEQLMLSVTDSDRGTAAAIDGEVVPRMEWPLVTLREGQAVELLNAVQGG
jgi:sulfur carrier protein